MTCELVAFERRRGERCSTCTLLAASLHEGARWEGAAGKTRLGDEDGAVAGDVLIAPATPRLIYASTAPASGAPAPVRARCAAAPAGRRHYRLVLEERTGVERGE